MIDDRGTVRWSLGSSDLTPPHHPLTELDTTSSLLVLDHIFFLTYDDNLNTPRSRFTDERLLDSHNVWDGTMS